MFLNSVVELIALIACAAATLVSGLSFVSKELHNETLQVPTRKGIIQGREDRTPSGKPFFSYQSIPFARPPLGNLRFRSPKPAEKWIGVLNATQDLPGCMEIRIRWKPLLSAWGQEDCLYLNVYTPENPQINKKNLPVMVWIFGGGFGEGNCSFRYYGPQHFMEHDVMIVTLNYRVGIFGFLSTEDEASPGNYGLKDQNAALHWVQANIEFFGGDPSRVTIFGQSAGAASVMFQMVSKKSRGLFSRAIAMSGETLTRWGNQKYPKDVAKDLGFTLGIDITNTTQFVEELRRMPSRELIDASMKVFLAAGTQTYFNGLPYTPSIEPDHEDAFISKLTYLNLKEGDVSKVPLMIGHTTAETLVILSLLPIVQPFFFFFDLSPSSIQNGVGMPVFNTKEGASIIKKYSKSNSIISATEEEIVQVFSDVFFVVPIERTVRLLCSRIPVYRYLFNYTSDIQDLVERYSGGILKPKSVAGTGHGEDLPFLWNLDNMSRIFNERDKLVSDRYLKLVTNFAKYGNPTPAKDPLLENIIWPKVMDPENVPYLNIGEDLFVSQNYRGEYIKLWTDIASPKN